MDIQERKNILHLPQGMSEEFLISEQISQKFLMSSHLRSFSLIFMGFDSKFEQPNHRVFKIPKCIVHYN